MGIPVSTLAARLEDFCKRYKVPKRYHGSLDMLAEMANVFDIELEPHVFLKVNDPMTTPPERAAHEGKQEQTNG